MTKEFNLFILWANGRHKEKEIIADISHNFEILTTFEITWSEKLFNHNLARFYGKKLPNARRKKKICGTGSFLVVCVNDTHPNLYEGKNINILMAKARYRRMLEGNLIHASDHQYEAEENLLFLTGLTSAEISNKHFSEIIHLYQDLIGAPSWLDEEQFERIVKKIPEVRLYRDGDVCYLETCDIKKACRLLNARKKLFSCRRDNYLIPIRGKEVRFRVQPSV